MKTKSSMKSFSSSRLDTRWLRPTLFECDASVCLLFPFSSPPLHTGRDTIELDSVCQVVNILKITGWFGSTGRPSLFRLQCACSKPGLFSFQSRYSDQRWKLELFLVLFCFHPRALSGLALTWERLKVMPVNHTHHRKAAMIPHAHCFISMASSWQIGQPGSSGEKQTSNKKWVFN